MEMSKLKIYAVEIVLNIVRIFVYWYWKKNQGQKKDVGFHISDYGSLRFFAFPSRSRDGRSLERMT